MKMFDGLPGYTIAERADKAVDNFFDWWLDDRATVKSIAICAVLLALHAVIHWGAR